MYKEHICDVYVTQEPLVNANVILFDSIMPCGQR